MTSFPEAYVRIAKPHEYTEIAWILTRGFARDPCMNWFGGVRQMIPDYQEQPDYTSHPASAKRTLKNLFTFQSALVKAVIPPQQGESNEILAAATLWLKPGQPLNFPLSVIIGSGVWKVLLGWGLRGVKRILLDFSPVVEKSLKRGFNAYNLDVLDSWYLLEIATDPPYDGKGLCSLLMKDGFERTSPKPIHLEASTFRTRDIYAHFGFEIHEEHRFGKGSVDVNGLVAKGEAATGHCEWIMTKVFEITLLLDLLISSSVMIQRAVVIGWNGEIYVEVTHDHYREKGVSERWKDAAFAEEACRTPMS